MYDIVIIGAGITGCAIARELSKYQLNIAVIESNSDVAMGSTGANSAIVHAGYDCKPNTLMAKLNVKGNKLYDQWHEELNIPLKRIGSLVLAFNETDKKQLEKLYQQGLENGVPYMKLLGLDETKQIEPNVNDNVVASLYAPTAGITCPYEASIALIENAVMNGVEVFLNEIVTAINNLDDSIEVTTNKQTITAKQLINCAGVYADEIAKLAGGSINTITPRKGEYCLFDKREAKKVSHILFQPPTELGKGILVTPTVDNNLLIGPNAVDGDDKEDTSCTTEGLTFIKKQATRSINNLNNRNIIRVFSGLRATTKKHDFIIERDKKENRIIHVAGICSPGLSAAPAIAKEVEKIIARQTQLIIKENYNRYRQGIPRFSEASIKEKKELIKKDARFGKIVCRCETVSEGEIVEAIHRPIPATTIDAIKRRTRSGMGRCQGGFCTPRIMEIISRETNTPMQEIKKRGGKSRIVVGEIKEVDNE